ncbi:hypothetical protein OAQ84_01160 [Bdellovibrionales bacterium]|nr:hypothetical protein [Bdellovibrionales bacterium]
MSIYRPSPTLRSESGMITLDYLFAFCLVMGFTAILFSLTFTLSVAEITQYITFASARSYYGSHISIVTQKNLGKEKYLQLVGHPVFKPLYSNGWFTVDSEVEPDDYSSIYGENPKSIFHGVRVSFLASVLDFNIPFFGSTSSSETKDSGFTAHIGSYLGREPTINECILLFSAQRWKKIRNLHKNYSQASLTDKYTVITDNGC